MWTRSERDTLWRWTVVGLALTAAAAVWPLPSAPALAAGAAVADRQLAAQRRIDLNSADRLALEALPGIGPVAADRILRDRRARGPFDGVEALGRVPGITPRLLERVRPHARAAAPPTKE